jgi:hypothetical protein
MSASKPERKTVFAIASAGGHFNQLMLLRPGFEGQEVTYLTTLPGLAETFGALPVRLIPDCNADTPLRVLVCCFVTGWQVLRHRPDAIVTTGALPGVIALAWGRTIGARTLWIDSIANAEKLSASGRLARRIAHCTLSQWPAVAEAEGVGYEGAVL